MMNIAQDNETLERISKIVLGNDAVFQIIDPKKLTLLKKNARFFKKETFKQLVNNIKGDSRLSSVPLCYMSGDAIEVLSGNHRVSAAVDAGVEHIMIILIKGDLTQNERISIQLSHNALVGEDDSSILKELWESIDDINARIYAGLSSDAVKEIEKIKLVNFTTPQVYTKTLTFAFTDSEMQNFEAIVKELEVLSGPAYIAPLERFNTFFGQLLAVKKTHGIKNGSLAMIKMIEIVEEHLQHLTAQDDIPCHSSAP